MRASDHVCRLLALSDAACLGMRVTRTSASSASATRFNVRKLAVLPPSRRAMTGCCIPARLASWRCDKPHSTRRSINCRIKAYSSSSASYSARTSGFFQCFFSDSRHGTLGRQVRSVAFRLLIRWFLPVGRPIAEMSPSWGSISCHSFGKDMPQRQHEQNRQRCRTTAQARI